MYDVLTEPVEDSSDVVEVEMNNSLYRQICAAEKRFNLFQKHLHTWYVEAVTGKLKRIT